MNLLRIYLYKFLRKQILVFLLLYNVAFAFEKATFGAGCFWGIENAFRKVEGVVSTSVGYAGGTTENPTYSQVCSHKTGHAEVVQIEYDPKRVTYEALLHVLFQIHDPTYQGPAGYQYRSVIFFHTPEQEKTAREFLMKMQSLYPRPLATEIQPTGTYYLAEEYHQNYYEKRGIGSCSRRGCR